MPLRSRSSDDQTRAASSKKDLSLIAGGCRRRGALLNFREKADHSIEPPFPEPRISAGAALVVGLCQNSPRFE